MLRILALIAALAASPAFAGTIYVDTGGSATNSGSTDQNTANLSGATSTDSTTTITLSGSPDLSGVVTTAGPTQSSIYLTNSTVANRKIYWITAKDDGADTVTVDTAPSCTAGACGAWAIGGRFVWTPASIEAALRAGDQVTINNSPASASADWLTGRTAGNATSGFIKIVGKTGVRPVITVTNTNQCFEGGAQAYWWFENLECAQQGGSGNAAQSFGANTVFYNVKISDAGAAGIQSNNTISVINSEITGTGNDGLQVSAAFLSGNYIHGAGDDGIELQGTSVNYVLTNNVVSASVGRGIHISSASVTANTAFVSGNTVYGSGNSGFEIVDADNRVTVSNNIFVENGNAAGEYNVEWAAGSAEISGWHGYNSYYHSNCQGSGTGGPSCVSGLTLTSTELSSDPLLTNPASGDFTLQSTSPAISAGYPGQLLGATGQGYLDLGPQQRQPSSGTNNPIGG